MRARRLGRLAADAARRAGAIGEAAGDPPIDLPLKWRRAGPRSFSSVDATQRNPQDCRFRARLGRTMANVGPESREFGPCFVVSGPHPPMLVEIAPLEFGRSPPASTPFRPNPTRSRPNLGDFDCIPWGGYAGQLYCAPGNGRRRGRLRASNPPKCMPIVCTAHLIYSIFLNTSMFVIRAPVLCSVGQRS